MAFKNGLFILIACLVVVLTPALSYAAGCCCMQTARMDVKEMPTDMPCHDATPDKVEIKGCFCDQGMVTPSLLPASQQTSSVIFYEIVSFEEIRDIPVATPQKRLLRPPITHS
jgi:hypothetical protein